MPAPMKCGMHAAEVALKATFSYKKNHIKELEH